MKQFIEKFDQKIIAITQKIFIPFGRFAIFVIFFWFGLLKVLDLSPANPLVNELLQKTLPLITFEQFIYLFGWYEVIIGICFIFPKLSRLAIFLLALHMITTLMPLVLLPQITWSGFLVPTLEGQYIIKNLVIIATAIGIASHLTPLGVNKK